MSALLGAVDARSCVIVQDVRAAAWGCRGQAQEQRYVSSRADAPRQESIERRSASRDMPMSRSS